MTMNKQIVVYRRDLWGVIISLLASTLIAIGGAIFAHVMISQMARRLKVGEFKDTNGYFIAGMRATWVLSVSTHSTVSVGCALWLYFIQRRAKGFAIADENAS
jgi:hypothetical protein